MAEPDTPEFLQPDANAYPFDDTGHAPRGYTLPETSPIKAGKGAFDALPGGAEASASLSSFGDGVPHRSVDLLNSSSELGGGKPSGRGTWARAASGTRRRTATTRPVTAGDGVRATLKFGETPTSFTGAYSRRPAISVHRRSKVASFSSGKRQFDMNVDPYNSPLKLKPMASIGKQTLSHQRNASGVVAPRGTRDEAQRVHPAMMPQPAGTAEVGPGRYRAAPSVGPQLLSTKRSAGATVIGSGLRPPLSSAATASPGPAYNPKYTFRTQAMNTPDVRFPQAERTSTVGPERSPGPVYDIMACSTGKAKPSFSIGKAKRPANVTRSYTNEMYDVSSTFAGHQRVAPKIGFGKAKRF